ncbi:hypothetical protein OBBRIDRAFT_800102 [Obba rivulosa]|uniref:Protein CPL1-like domain-containing protein n=1 Tax=Obba rivulosa TaxID=1052685 RepID=A0A8E2DV21_9APHY|nr:hypothetical protein OBBRIDRAFT_800102 [Obba rivulosa]
MTLISRLLLVAVALPFVLATGDSCGENNFLYEDKNCCVPYGGTPSPPSPPKGSSCPQSGWEWHEEQQCCVPHQPPANQPPPQCSEGWVWNQGQSKCCEGDNGKPSSPPANPPKPSSQPGGSYNHYKKRAMKSRSTALCPKPLDACPIAAANGLTGDYECIDTDAELESCGGCASTGAGQDCTAIEGAWNVGCNHGVCAVYTCMAGYKRASDGMSCVKL